MMAAAVAEVDRCGRHKQIQTAVVREGHAHTFDGTDHIRDLGGTRCHKEAPCCRGEEDNAPHISDHKAFDGGGEGHEGDGIHRGRRSHSTEFEACHTRRGDCDVVLVGRVMEGSLLLLLPCGNGRHSRKLVHTYHIQHHEGDLDSVNNHTLLGYRQVWGGSSQACSDGQLRAR